MSGIVDGHVATMHLHEKQIQFHNQADYTWGHNKIGRMLLITVINSSRCNYIVVIIVLKHPREEIEKEIILADFICFPYGFH